MKYPAVTVGVVTYQGSFVDFTSFLLELTPALRHYPGECQLVVVNNSGSSALPATQSSVRQSSIDTVCEYVCVGSTSNNIAVGRNTIFEYAAHNLVALLDDDEFPVPKWLLHLVDAHQRHGCGVVAGPAYPLYLFPTPQWVSSVDLHNATGKKSGQAIDNCATANVLIDQSSVVGALFNPEFGKSGGEDTEFMMRQHKHGVKLCWSNEAAVYEYIPAIKSTSRYMIKRCVLQGVLNRRILTERGEIASQTYFVMRSIGVCGLSLIVGGTFLILRHDNAGRWLKRGFGNLGHCFSFSAKLYPD